jgi:LPS export ABC transporter protein LptC
MDGEEMVLEVDAKEAYYFKDGKSVELKEPRAVFYGKGGTKTFLKGAKGNINTDSNDVEVEGDVRVDSDGSYHIETSYVKYLNKDRSIVSNRKVRFIGKGFIMKGRGMKALIDREKVYLNGDVEALIDNSLRGDDVVKKKSN